MSTITRNSALAATLLFVSASVVHTPVQAGPIHDAAKAGDAQQVERLIAEGVDVDEKDIADKTALLWAADAGQMDVVQVLVAKGANVNARDFSDWTPLMFAVLGHHDSPDTRFTKSSHPYILPDGSKIAEDYSDLTDGSILHPLDMEPTGNRIIGLDKFWTGTLADGKSASHSVTCTGWKADPLTYHKGMHGQTDLTTSS